MRLAYGEVQTTHTAQGSTATDHIYALPAGNEGGERLLGLLQRHPAPAELLHAHQRGRRDSARWRTAAR